MYQPINIDEHVWQNGGDKLVFEIYDVMCCFQKPFSFSFSFSHSKVGAETLQIRFHSHGATQKWMIYKGKSQSKMDDN